MSSPILPPELTFEILSWLPVKFLLRFRCISKQWKSLIFDPSLVKLHLQKSPKHTHVLLTFENLPNFTFLDPDFILSLEATQFSVRSLLEHQSSIVKEGDCLSFSQASYHTLASASANGLVCLVRINDFKEFYVEFWNPTLQLISKKSPTAVNLNVRGHILAHFGFGYDDSTDKYKVVGVYWDHPSKKWEGRVYCMGDNCWRKTLACPDFPILLGTGLFVNDSVNWLAIDNLNDCWYEWSDITIKKLVIFSLNLRKEACKYMFLPEGFCERPRVVPTLTALRGRLCLYYYHKRTHFVLWEMREFGVQESWTQLVNVSYMHLQIGDGSVLFYRPAFPVCLSENGDFLFATKYGSYITYNLKDDRVERIELNIGHICYAVEHMQSLVLPHPRP